MIKINDARTYFDLLIAAAPQAMTAYDDFIRKYTEQHFPIRK
jgi:hypothetical protein